MKLSQECPCGAKEELDGLDSGQLAVYRLDWASAHGQCRRLAQARLTEGERSGTGFAVTTPASDSLPSGEWTHHRYDPGPRRVDL